MSKGTEIVEAFTRDGTARELAANLPLPLDDPEGAWLVGESGQVDVFAVPLRDGKPDGARVHVLRARPGELLLGARWQGQGGETGLIAVGTPGTRVYRLDLTWLAQRADEPDRARQLRVLLDGWAHALTAGLGCPPPPKRLVPLASGLETQIEDGEPFGPVDGTVWVRHVQGTSWFLGRDELALGTAEGPFPVSSPGWLQGEPGTSLSVETTDEVIKAQWLGEGLERFHQVMLRLAAGNARDACAEDRRRQQHQVASQRDLLHATLSRLAAVFGPEEEQPNILGSGEHPLVAACRLVGARSGIGVQVPRAIAWDREQSDLVGAIARGSRVRVRRVLLSGDWWQRDNGPLLGFRAEDEHPIALLPVSPCRYEAVDPATGTATPLSAASAPAVRPFGYQFYRPLPASALTLWDLFCFGLSGSRRDLLTVVWLGLAGGLLGMFPPIALGWIFDRIAPSGERGRLLLVVLALAASAVAAVVFRFTQGLAMLRAETMAESQLEAGVWDRLLNLPASFFRKYTAGDLATRAMGIATIRQVLTDVAWSSLISVLFSLVSLTLLFVYNVRLAVVVVAAVAVIVAVAWAVSLVQLRYERRIQDQRGRIAGLVLQLITGISRLRVAGAEERALAVWAREFGPQRRLTFQAQSLLNNLAAFNAAAPILAALVLYAAVAMLPAENFSLGMFLAFNAAFTQVLLASAMLSNAAGSVLQVVPLYERARPILEAQPEVDPVRVEPEPLNGEIEVNHVSFRYQADSPQVLDDVSVHVRPGEFVAFVGPSGAGKSTLLRLLLGFEAPSAGSIYFDRQDLAGLDQQAVRRQIGVVLQSGKLMPGDLFTNIAGSFPLTLDEAWEAARLSGFDEDIAQMPMGMFTVITEGENILSGGQRQRLMIARAIATRPRILFFDEATSALDNTTQAKVRQSLANLKATRIVVAHRLSTVMYADCIYVMQAGRIVQRGGYDELMRQPGLFVDLVRRQLA